MTGGITMVDSVGLNKVYSIPKTRSVAHKKAERSKSDPEREEQTSKKKQEKKRIGGNIDEVC
jgi:hypothetical protein